MEIPIEKAPVILVVDDTPTILIATSRLVSKAGYAVLQAKTGTEALEVAVREKPALVLLDVHLPDIDGLEVCRRLKREPGLIDTFVVHVSGTRTASEEQAEGLMAGADGYIARPVGNQELLARIEVLLRLRETQNTLRQSEQRTRTLTEISPVGIFYADREGRYQFTNARWCKIAGLTPEEAQGGGWVNGLHPGDRETIREKWRLAVQNNQPFQAEYRFQRPDGSITWVFGQSVAETNALGEVVSYVGTITDFTERRRMESAILEAEKLVSLGTLSAGLAHEANSPLQVIVGVASSLLKQVGNPKLTDEILTEKLEMIHRNAWRIAKIVSGLMVYAHPVSTHIEWQHLNTIVEETIASMQCRKSISGAPDVKTRLGSDLPQLQCNQEEIARLLTNLLNNACDTTRLKGGQIVVETGWDAERQMLFLIVSDQGEGITPDHQASIFEPFFTTRPVGEGVGLGLSIVHSIVQAHGGEILVDSVPGKGSVFTVYLPQTPPNVAIQPRAGRYSS